jgi:hypothetical protein
MNPLLRGFARRRGRKNIEEAAKMYRSGTIGLLECCDCSYPLELADTDTGHELDCQAHRMTISSRTVAAATGRAWPAHVIVPKEGPLCPTCQMPVASAGVTCSGCAPAAAWKREAARRNP